MAKLKLALIIRTPAFPLKGIAGSSEVPHGILQVLLAAQESADDAVKRVARGLCWGRLFRQALNRMAL